MQDTKLWTFKNFLNIRNNNFATYSQAALSKQVGTYIVKLSQKYDFPKIYLI